MFGRSTTFVTWLGCVALLSLATGDASAQFTIPTFTIASGGGQSSGGAFVVLSCVGQPMAASGLSGGNFSVSSGYVAAASSSPYPCLGDLNGDKTIGQADLGILLAAYGTCPGQPGYNAAAGTLAGDPCVGQADLGVLLAVYGTTCP